MKHIAIGLMLGLSLQVSATETVLSQRLANAATIQYDAEGIPHITGDELSETDIAFAQGYAHAGQRFFQMDITRRVASGTLAELVGSSVLDQDIQLRTMGLRRAAWQTWVAMNDDTRAWLRAYADGVNAWLAHNPLPPEYTGLELSKATPWQPVDSIVVAKALAFQLSFDLDIDLTIKAAVYQQAGEAAGFDGTALFLEDTHRSQPPDGRVTAPGFLESIGGLGKSGQSPQLGTVDPQAARLAEAYREKIENTPFFAKALNPDKQGAGSNWWIVDGAHTTSGSPMLANDPHLSLNLPSIFMEAYLPQAAGVSVPGTPGIIQGCTLYYCWGSTVHPMDVTDTFMEQLETNNFGLPTHIVHDGVKEPLLWIYQSYYANVIGDGEMDNLQRQNVGYDAGGITFIVPRRNHGPLIQVDVENKTGLSVQYTGWGPTFELEAFRRMNNGQNLEDFKTALQFFDVGSQNFGYADRDGNIAYFASAEMPLREDLQTLNTLDGGIPPFMIRDGSGALKHEWLPLETPQPYQALPYEILPFEEMPQRVNPDTGYLANANNDPVGVSLDNNPFNQLRPGGGIYYLNPFYSAYRMGRVDRVMQDMVSKGDVDFDKMQALQANHQLLDAELMTPHILTAFDRAGKEDAWPGLQQFLADPRLVEAVERLALWDFSTPTGIREGYDPGDDPYNLPEPSEAEIRASVAATVFAVWRSRMLANTIDAVFEAMGLSQYRPLGRLAYNALKHHLDSFEQNRGVGLSGIPFFNVPGAPTPADARDFIILYSLQQGLAMLASDAFSAAFGNSEDLNDYRWGKLHRIVFDHPLGPPFDVPNHGPFTDLSPELPGLARSGGYEAVDASRHDPRAETVNGFMFGAGPARRFIGELLEDGILGHQTIPGGQSGNITSPLYASQLPRWLTNQYHDLLPGRPPAAIMETVELLPAERP